MATLDYNELAYLYLSTGWMDEELRIEQLADNLPGSFSQSEALAKRIVEACREENNKDLLADIIRKCCEEHQPKI